MSKPETQKNMQRSILADILEGIILLELKQIDHFWSPYSNYSSKYFFAPISLVQ